MVVVPFSGRLAKCGWVDGSLEDAQSQCCAPASTSGKKRVKEGEEGGMEERKGAAMALHTGCPQP